ncbi:MAG: hypothetical protein J5I93_24340 [Pirellulaceae bacterium]|nr:hypothetical protein [Pirellulaceae bacterium]
MWDQVVLGAPRWGTVAAALVVVAVVALGWSYLRGLRPATASAGRTMALMAAALLKLVGILALAACLVEPLFSGVRPRPGANVFGLLVDNSRSMQISNPGQRQSRADQLHVELARQTAWRTRLEQDFDVRGYTFDARLQRRDTLDDLPFDGTASNLGPALNTVASRFGQRPVAGVLLFSDGNDTSQEASARDWSQLGFPVYPVIDDQTSELRDVRLAAVNVAQSNFETAPVTVAGEVVCDGLAGQELVVRLLDEQQGQVAEQTLEAAADGQPSEFRFRFRPPRPGVSFFHLHVCLESERGRYGRGQTNVEATLANNHRVLVVDRGGAPYRVLYVGGRPNWEFKFLRRALAEDVEVQLSGLLRIARQEPKFSFRDQRVTSSNPLFEGFDGKDEDEKERYDQPVLLRLGIEGGDELRDGFPRTAAELFAYDAVILDDLEAAFFSAEQLLLLRQFVAARGGGLLLLGGQESFREGGYQGTALGELSPVYLDRATSAPSDVSWQWDLTREGWLQTWTRLRANEPSERQRLDAMPPFLVFNPPGEMKPGASILASVSAAGDENVRPALVSQRFGKGKSAALLVGDLWRWGMHREDLTQSDLPQAWRQLVRWLVSDVPKRIEVQARRDPDPSRPMRLEVLVRDDEFRPLSNASVALRGTDPEGNSFELATEPSSRQVGVYEARYWPRQDGGYRIEAVATAADGSEIGRRETGWTSQPSAEEFQQLQANRRLLDELARQTGGEVISSNQLESFVRGLPNRKVPVTEPWVYPLWHQPWLFGLAICCLCGEWGLRRWKGLP